jgi:hypothetical protein
MFSCSSGQKEAVKAPDLKGLSGFFTTFEKDMKNSTDSISQQDLVKSLSHLLRMDFGGSKYYPLEREALTKMINALASYQYAECILLNKSGVIIYSMYEDDMLSKKADYYPKSIGVIFNNVKSADRFILDGTAVLGSAGKKVILFGMAVNTKEGFQGVLISGIEAGKVMEYSGVRDLTVNGSGMIVLDGNTDNIAKPVSEIPEYSAKSKKESFSYRNISWDIFR